MLGRRRIFSIASLTEAIQLSNDFDVVSFDVFDTLLYRRALGREEIQHLSSQWLMPYLDHSVMGHPQSVIFYREHTCNILRDSVTLNSREPSLDAILERLLATRGRIKDPKERSRLARQAVEFELGLEHASLVPMPGAAETLAALKAAGKRLIAVSDMYFAASDVEALLDAKGLRGFFEEVFVSSQVGFTKHEGQIFESVRQILGVEARRILHIGDNRISDVDNATRAGWAAAHFIGRQPSIPVTQLVTGQERLQSIAGDIMASFLMSVLMEAREKQVRKVFFLSRDATVMLRIWERVRATNQALAELFADIEMVELCVSRASTHWLSMLWTKDFVAEAVGRLAWLNSRPISYREFVGHYGLPLPRTAGKADVARPDGALALAVERDGLAPELRKVVLSRQQDAVDYLLQEGAIGNGRVIFADIGYSGTVAVYITNYLLREAPELLPSTDIIVKMVASNTYIPGNRTFAAQAARIDDGILATAENLPTILSDNYAWIESLFKDVTRGALRGYSRADGRLVPVFGKKPGMAETPWKALEDAAVAKLDIGLDALAYACPQTVDRIRTQMIALFSKPDMDFVQAMSALSQERDAINGNAHSIVEAVPATAIVTRLRHWKTHDYWIAGCLVASGQARIIDRYHAIKVGNTRLRQLKAVPRRAVNLARKVARRVLR